MKKIYIGDKITTPSWDEWVALVGELNVLKYEVHTYMCSIPAVVQRTVDFLISQDGGLISLDTDGGFQYTYPKKQLEALMGCEFINEKRPEETYKESFNKTMGDPLNHSILKTEEPMNKLKTRDEVIRAFHSIDIRQYEWHELVDEFIEKGIIQVAEEDEVPELDLNNCFKNIVVENKFIIEADWMRVADAIIKFARLSWYFNKQANGGVHWVPDWYDLSEKHFGGFNYKESKIETMVSEYFQMQPNFFYFKTPEAREKTLAQMTKEELKLLGLSN